MKRKKMGQNNNNEPQPVETTSARIADANYWLSAPMKEVKIYLKKNTNIEQYKKEKKQLLSCINRIAKYGSVKKVMR